MKFNKLFLIALKYIALCFCTFCSIVFFVFFWNNFINAEIFTNIGIWVGSPIFIVPPFPTILKALALLCVMFGTGFFVLKGEKITAKFTYCLIVVFFTLAIGYPNIISYRSMPYCEWFRKVADIIFNEAGDYFEKHEVAVELPSINDVVDYVPPGFTAQLTMVENKTILLTVWGQKDACPKYDSISQRIK